MHAGHVAVTALRALPTPEHRLPLEHELTLVGGAIDLVASGRATRVTVVGLHWSDELLHRARALANDAPLTFGTEWREDDTCDLTVEASR